jgi:hypothetical protein
VTAVDSRRLAIAFACAIAIHEALIVLIPTLRPLQGEGREVITHVTIARVDRRPKPKPSPTATPTPQRPVVHRLAASGVRAHVETIKHAGARRPAPPTSRFATPLPMVVPTGGTGAGAQNGAGPGSVSSVEGNGNGTGVQGSGNGGGMCGAVDFEALGDATFDPSSGLYSRSNIVATVHYADGTQDRIPLDWTWHWMSEADDPFSVDSGAPMLFQFPPPDRRAAEPPVVQFIMQHTTAHGLTRLNGQCPNIPPAPENHTSPEQSPKAVPGLPDG